MSDPRFRRGQREGSLAELLPDWAPRAACAELGPNQGPYSAMFQDDVAQRPDPDSYNWPASVTHAMRICATCPVRPECLNYCFESEKRESTLWWQNELVPQNRRFGIFGGIPGRIREFYGDVEGCEAWFQRWWSLQPKAPSESPETTIEGAAS